MYRIQTLDRISTAGLEIFSRENYEIASDLPNPDAILVRSFRMNDIPLPASLKAIARAGAGVNNIPVKRCTQNGIVVFFTPGANANSVKELVLAGLILSSRKVLEGVQWVQALAGKADKIPSLVEQQKGEFSGPEIKGKRLGVIGLGAIGVMVANDAVSLGMKVSGFDPFISVESAWGLSSQVERAMGLETLISESDFLTIHVPLTETTKGLINRDKFNIMKPGVRLLNFARGGLVNNEDLQNAIEKGVVGRYVTDFPDERLVNMANVITIPHLGATTPEAEDNCARMAVERICDYLEYGNIQYSANFPNCSMPPAEGRRLVIANRNVPKMVSQITSLLADDGVNISEMINRHRDDLAYNIIDVDEDVHPSIIAKMEAVEGVIMVRII